MGRHPIIVLDIEPKHHYAKCIILRSAISDSQAGLCSPRLKQLRTLVAMAM